MRWTQEQYDEFLRKANPNHALDQQSEVKSKHGNQKITIDGQTFDSKREYNRYCQLKMMESKGLISKLERQVKYDLAPSVKINGKTKPALRYFADFVYLENGQKVVEDAKGHQTDVYKIKRHLMKAFLSIDIKET